MYDGADMGVIEVQAVHQDAVEQGRVTRGQPEVLTDHRMRPLTREPGNGRRAPGREIKALRSESDTEGIGHTQARIRPDRLGHGC